LKAKLAKYRSQLLEPTGKAAAAKESSPLILILDGFLKPNK
jgi:hypothetical protein